MLSSLPASPVLFPDAEKWCQSLKREGEGAKNELRFHYMKIKTNSRKKPLYLYFAHFGFCTSILVACRETITTFMAFPMNSIAFPHAFMGTYFSQVCESLLVSSVLVLNSPVPVFAGTLLSVHVMQMTQAGWSREQEEE